MCVFFHQLLFDFSDFFFGVGSDKVLLLLVALGVRISFVAKLIDPHPSRPTHSYTELVHSWGDLPHYISCKQLFNLGTMRETLNFVGFFLHRRVCTMQPFQKLHYTETASVLFSVGKDTMYNDHLTTFVAIVS